MQYPKRTAQVVAWAVIQRMQELGYQASETRVAGQMAALFALRADAEVANTACWVADLLEANGGERTEVVEYALEEETRIRRR